MGSQDKADSRVGVLFEGVPDLVNVSFVTEGSLQQLDENSLLGLRIDYAVGDDYERSVLWHGGLHDANHKARIPWGTERGPEQVVEVQDLSDIQLSPAQYAPEGWSGRLIMTFMMQNTGAQTRAKVFVRQRPPVSKRR